MEKHGGAWIKPQNLVCNGSYLLEEWKLDDHMRLRKNPRYWDAANVAMTDHRGPPHLRAQHRHQLLPHRRGGPDHGQGHGPHLPHCHPQNQTLVPHRPLPRLLLHPFQRHPRPFDNAKVRQAFALAIDRRRITEKITQLGEIPAWSLTPPGAGTANYQPPPGLGLILPAPAPY
jgi:oligopeptide transport system substrate-binding protein